MKLDRQESIEITGCFGPIKASNESPLKLEITPITVFIGPQGTGKSLISQLLYFFRDAHYLLSNYSKQDNPNNSVRKVIEGIRSGESTNRALASFVTGNVDIKYSIETQKRGIALYENNRAIRPKAPFTREVQTWLTSLTSNPAIAGEIMPKALFIPAERSFFSRLINSDPAALGSRDLPITMREFTKALTKSANTHQQWQDQAENYPTEFSEIDNLISHELRGKALFSRHGPYARKWQWVPEGSQRPIEIEMTSSGQMETWPMVSIAQAIFGWHPTERPLFIHIEEPETHLHPSAQVAITSLLAYLCNKGFRLIITTHSIFILYVLNNLIMAKQSLPDMTFSKMPDISQRLNSKDISAYLFTEKTAISIRDPETGEIDESRLSSVLGDLETQYNQIQSYGILWE
jgi:hypothetical protein